MPKTKTQPPSDKPGRRGHGLEYFQPGQVVLHVEHRAEFDQAQLERLLKRLAPTLERLDLRWRPEQVPMVNTFHASEGAHFSLATVEVLGTGNDPDRLVALLTGLDEV